MNIPPPDTANYTQNNANTSSLEVIAPKVFPGTDCQEMDVLGSIIWLWEHSPEHQNIPLVMLPILLYPIITHRQFILAYENKRPIFFLGWAALSEAAEARYITNPAVHMPQADWCSGERLWFTDFVAPFGHTQQMMTFLRSDWMRYECGRSLYHRGEEQGFRVMQFRGKEVDFNAFKQWQAKYPLAKKLSS